VAARRATTASTLARAHARVKRYDAIVVLPYTRVRRQPGAASPYRMSHFTARCLLAGLELYEQGVARRFILPGEQRLPATSDLEREFLLRRGVAPDCVLDFANLNGTLQQLEPAAALQQRGCIRDVVVVCFAFHVWRVRQYMRLLRVRGDVAEVEDTHATFLRLHRRAVRVERDELVNLPQLKPFRRAELGISRALLLIDCLFGRLAPASRLFKFVVGPTLTDIEHGRPRMSLARIEAARARFAPLQTTANVRLRAAQRASARR
jgi:hypothetical protein